MRMLKLTRRIGETIIVGDLVGPEIAITVVNVIGQQVRLGIGAPKDVRVLREELVEREAARGGATPGVPSRA